MPAIDVRKEIEELRGHFPDVSRSDFYELDNGNIGVVLQISTSGQYALGTFEVVLEFPLGYPDIPPNAWVNNPDLDESCGHVYYTENGQGKICFTADKEWDPRYTSYDAVAMIKSWIFGYCKWEHTGEWGWDEAGFLDYLLKT
jgi:ubiquitin-protein ligase